MERCRTKRGSIRTDPQWRSAHSLLGDSADHYALPYEVLLAFEELHQRTRDDQITDLLAQGLKPTQIAHRLHVPRSYVRAAAKTWRRRRQASWMQS